MTNKKIIHPNSLLTRRTAMSGLALGGAGLMAAGMSAPPTLAKTDWTLDLDSAEDNCKAMIKLQADLSGADTFGGFAGDVWAWVPNEGNFHVFNTYGIGASHVEYRPAERAWRFYHREALLYLDPQTNEILDSWYNPFTEQRVEVLHIINEHVNRYYEVGGKDDTNLRNRKGGINFPRPYEVHGDNLLFRVSFYRLEDNVMPRKDYPLHSQSDKYQTTELWGMMGRLSEIMDPNVTSASCMTSWSRIAGWLPFMEMGDRPGQIGSGRRPGHGWLPDRCGRQHVGQLLRLRRPDGGGRADGLQTEGEVAEPLDLPGSKKPERSSSSEHKSSSSAEARRVCCCPSYSTSRVSEA